MQTVDNNFAEVDDAGEVFCGVTLRSPSESIAHPVRSEETSATQQHIRQPARYVLWRRSKPAGVLFFYPAGRGCSKNRPKRRIEIFARMPYDVSRSSSDVLKASSKRTSQLYTYK